MGVSFMGNNLCSSIPVFASITKIIKEKLSFVLNYQYICITILNFVSNSYILGPELEKCLMLGRGGRFMLHARHCNCAQKLVPRS